MSALHLLRAARIVPSRISQLYLTPALRPKLLKSTADQGPPDQRSSEQSNRDGSEVYLNACVSVRSSKQPGQLLRVLKWIETDLGRRRQSERWADRVIDMDLIDYRGAVMTDVSVSGGNVPFKLPHPAVQLRPFVLAPILEVAPLWKHPVSRRSPEQLLLECRSAKHSRCADDMPSRYGMSILPAKTWRL